MKYNFKRSQKEEESPTKKPKTEKTYFHQNHEERQKEVIEFCKKAYKIQTEKQLYPNEDTPELAYKRFQEYNYLRDVLYGEIKKLKLKGLPLSLERWCMTQKLLETDGDPLIPNPKDDYDISLYYELRNCFATEQEAKNICLILANESRKSCELLKKFVSDKTTYRIDVLNLRGYKKIKYRDLDYSINDFHFTKLEKLYFRDTTSDKDKFLSRLFCLLCRYNTLGAPGYQGALPDALFEYLNQTMEIKQECFASPLNCSLPRYNSAFYDVDRYFGSSGSFFNQNFSEGSFEANPPFIEEFMILMAMHIQEALKVSDKPLSFFIVLPAWEDSETYVMLSKSEFYKGLMRFEGGDHKYMDGAQHQREVQERFSVAPTFVFVLQNQFAMDKWKWSEETIRLKFMNKQ